MSTIRKVPYIEQVIGQLTEEDLNSLKNVINNPGTVNRSLINENQLLTNDDEDSIFGVNLELELGNIKTGILINFNGYRTLIAYHQYQDLKLYKILDDKRHFKVIDEFLNIEELRRIVFDTVSGTIGSVESVNGQSGVVVLTADDINASNSATIQANLERIDGRIDDYAEDNIEGSETISFDLNEAGTKYQIRLDQDVIDDIDNSLKLGTAPTDDALVSVNTSNEQQFLYLGDALDISGNVINVEIVDDVVTTLNNKPLSAKQGKLLADRINNLEARGRFLSVWNANTGKPNDLPNDESTLSTKYDYKTGDYFIVGTAGSKNPTGTSIAAGTTISTFPSVTGTALSVNDTIVFNGSSWTFIHYAGAPVTFSGITGNYSDNTSLLNAFNAKQDKITSSNKLAYSLVSGTPTKLSDFTNDAGFITAITKSTVSSVGGLVLPSSTPSTNELVGVSTSNAQLRVSLGAGLAMASNNALKVTGIEETRASGIIKLWVGTQAQYNSIGSKDSNTVYYIVG